MACTGRILTIAPIDGAAMNERGWPMDKFCLWLVGGWCFEGAGGSGRDGKWNGEYTQNHKTAWVVICDVFLPIRDFPWIKVVEPPLYHRNNNADWIRGMKNDPTTIFLYAQNFEKNLKNQDKRVELSKQDNVPVDVLSS